MVPLHGDCGVPFRYRNGLMFLTQFTDYIRHIMRSKGHHIVNYVDDLLGLESEGHSMESYNFKAILGESRIPNKSVQSCPSFY